MIQVQHEDGERALVAPCTLHLLAGDLEEPGPIQYPGQGVVGGEVPEHGFIALAHADIAKEPDPTEVLPTFVEHPHRMTLKGPAILQFNFAVVTCTAVCVEFSNPADEALRVPDPLRCLEQDRCVMDPILRITRHKTFSRNAPDSKELLVIGDDTGVTVDNENTVGRGFLYRPQQGSVKFLAVRRRIIVQIGVDCLVHGHCAPVYTDGYSLTHAV